jgi:hypothetical protein
MQRLAAPAIAMLFVSGGSQPSRRPVTSRLVFDSRDGGLVAAFN